MKTRCFSISGWGVLRGVGLTLHGGDIGALDVVLEFGKLLLEFVEGDELVLNDEGDLELLDTVADSNKLGATPNETFLFDGTNRLLEGRHVCFVIPRFNLKRHNRLHVITSTRCSAEGVRITNLRDGFGFVGLLGVVCSDTFGFELLSFSVILLIGSKEIDVIITSRLFLLLSGRRGSLTGKDGTGAAGARKGGELSLVGPDVFVPASDIGVS